MHYKIKADAISYSEWSIDEDGKLAWCDHNFEGSDISSYKIIDEFNETIEDEIETYAEAIERRNKLEGDYMETKHS